MLSTDGWKIINTFSQVDSLTTRRAPLDAKSLSGRYLHFVNASFENYASQQLTVPGNWASIARI